LADFLVGGNHFDLLRWYKSKTIRHEYFSNFFVDHFHIFHSRFTAAGLEHSGRRCGLQDNGLARVNMDTTVAANTKTRFWQMRIDLQ
jgi:hypothetical protein